MFGVHLFDLAADPSQLPLRLEDVGDAAFFALAGRYEFHNKGIELLLDALAAMKDGKGRRVVAFLLVPSGNSGARGELLDRLAGGDAKGPIGLCTHNLFDEANDPVHRHCKRLGLDNAVGSRVKVVQVPIYLRPDDGLFGREYEAVLAAMDLGAYPSYYEPWGYTPQEVIAVGVPTITTDLAGFGRWAVEAGLGPDDGITVLPRERVCQSPSQSSGQIDRRASRAFSSIGECAVRQSGDTSSPDSARTPRASEQRSVLLAA
jgi:glycosyltransferase involved in cell wall biosynthesis